MLPREEGNTQKCAETSLEIWLESAEYVHK